MRKLKSLLPFLRVLVISIAIIGMVVFTVSHSPGLVARVKKIVTLPTSDTPSQWVLDLRKVYTLCGHVVSKSTIYHKESEFREALSNYPEHLLKMAERFFVYSGEIKDYCETCKNNQFLGLYNQKVVVLRGTPEKPGPIIEEIKVRVNNLPDSEVKDLRKGISFRDEKEKLQLIEGLVAD